jgi:hypothetical protein
MSWTLSVVGRDAEEAKREMRAANEAQGGHVPEAAMKLAEAAADALPETKVAGYGAVAISTYGHFAADPVNGTSNFSLSVQHVNSDGLKSAA